MRGHPWEGEGALLGGRAGKGALTLSAGAPSPESTIYHESRRLTAHRVPFTHSNTNNTGSTLHAVHLHPRTYVRAPPRVAPCGIRHAARALATKVDSRRACRTSESRPTQLSKLCSRQCEPGPPQAFRGPASRERRRPVPQLRTKLGLSRAYALILLDLKTSGSCRLFPLGYLSLMCGECPRLAPDFGWWSRSSACENPRARFCHRCRHPHIG